MKRSHFVQGLLSTVSALTAFTACAEIDTPDQPVAPPLAKLVASARSTAELGVATWEVRADGADVRVIGRDATSARQAEMIIRRDAATPDDRVQIEAVFPDHGELQVTRAGVVEASSDALRRLGADVHADLGRGATPVVADAGPGLGSTTSALAISDRGTIHMDWQLFGYSINPTLGGPCRAGTTRDHGEVYADYGASGVWLGWAYPNGPATDCTSRFFMTVQNGHWDDFHWSIYTQPINFAAGKAATQSSTPWGSYAARAVDGNVDGNWYDNSVTHTDFDARAWWQVDLGVVTEIGQVVVYNRTDCCTTRLSDFDILVSNDGIDWQVVASNPGPAPARTPFTMRTSGRLVRIQLRGTDYLSLAEVQIFAP